MTDRLAISVAIPTYRRERVLLETIEYLLRLPVPPAEILVLDQTPEHLPETEQALRAWNESACVRWLRLREPSIPAAMNRGLVAAQAEYVLFLDDDIVPDAELIAAHARAHAERTQERWIVAGRVLQPWDGDIDRASWADKEFASTEARAIEGFMGGNFSIARRDALAISGFDENFVRVAYNFEREFADRWRRRGGRVWFCPQARIRHLKAAAGGTRSFGEHLTTLSPAHSVGAYYFLLRARQTESRVRAFCLRPLRAVMTRHHLRQPWWIPVTFIAELTGMFWALLLYLRGPRYCSTRLSGDR